MKDIQSSEDTRRIPIRKVGVKNISYPVQVLDKENKLQHTVANINMYVNLPHRFKGTHMSRFVETLNNFHQKINLHDFHLVLLAMKEKLEAEESHIEINFPYFINDNKTDKTKKYRQTCYQCSIHASVETNKKLQLKIIVPIVTPSHKTIEGHLPSTTGLWGQAELNISFQNFIWIEELIEIAEKAIYRSSLQISVEKVCKQIALCLSAHKDINRFRISVENIAPGYSTFASISSTTASA